MPNPDDTECMGPDCEELKLVPEKPMPSNPDNPVTDPDDPNDGVVTTAPREDIQIDPQDRLDPYINWGETEGDLDESLFTVANPEIDQNHNPEPIDPQPLLSEGLTNSGTALDLDGYVVGSPYGSFSR